MELGWRTTVLLVTGLPSLMAAIMILAGAREVIAARFFLALVAAWVMFSGPYIIGFSGAYQAYPWLTFFPFNTEVYIGPLWLLTVRALTSESLPRRWWMWLVPGAIQTLYYTTLFFAIGPGWGMGEGAADAKFAFSDAFHEPYIVPIETAVGLSLIAYAAWESWRRIGDYRAWIGQEHSNADRVDLAWLQRAGGAIIVLALVWLASDIAGTILGGLSYVTNFWFYAISGVVVLWVALQFLARSDRRFPKPLSGGERAVAAQERAQSAEETAQESAHAQPEPRFALEVVEAKVRDGGWHFDQDLTLGELARRLGTNSSTLSASLNAREDINFNIFINGLRVDAVCERLRSSRGGDSGRAGDVGGSVGPAPNLLDLALDCGFGSKATFNRAFKRHTGLSPREWIAQQGSAPAQAQAA